MYIISGCLLGYNCKYNGKNNLCPDVVKFAEEHNYVMVCPETAGGLTSPREPAEVLACNGDTLKVMNRAGEDVTEYFIRGAEKSWQRCLDESNCLGESIEGAILKARSPSCGIGQIYDGTFTSNVVSGNGIFTQMLVDRCIKVESEETYIDKFK